MQENEIQFDNTTRKQTTVIKLKEDNVEKTSRTDDGTNENGTKPVKREKDVEKPSSGPSKNNVLQVPRRKSFGDAPSAMSEISSNKDKDSLRQVGQSQKNIRKRSRRKSERIRRKHVKYSLSEGPLSKKKKKKKRGASSGKKDFLGTLPGPAAIAYKKKKRRRRRSSRRNSTIIKAAREAVAKAKKSQNSSLALDKHAADVAAPVADETVEGASPQREHAQVLPIRTDEVEKTQIPARSPSKSPSSKTADALHQQALSASIFVAIISKGVRKFSRAITATYDQCYRWPSEEASRLVVPLGDTCEFQLFVGDVDGRVRQMGRGFLSPATLVQPLRSRTSPVVINNGHALACASVALSSDTLGFVGCVKFNCSLLRRDTERHNGEDSSSLIQFKLLGAFCVPEVVSLVLASRASSPRAALRAGKKSSIVGAVALLLLLVVVAATIASLVAGSDSLCARPRWQQRNGTWELCDHSATSPGLLKAYWVTALLSGAGELYRWCGAGEGYALRVGLALLAAIGSAVWWVAAAWAVRWGHDKVLRRGDKFSKPGSDSFSHNSMSYKQTPFRAASAQVVPESSASRTATPDRPRRREFCTSVRRARACPLAALLSVIVYLATGALVYAVAESGNGGGSVDGNAGAALYFAATKLSTTGTMLPTPRSPAGLAVGVMLHMLSAPTLALLVHTIARLVLKLHRHYIKQVQAATLSLANSGLAGVKRFLAAATSAPSEGSCSEAEFVLHAARSLDLVGDKDIQVFGAMWDDLNPDAASDMSAHADAFHRSTVVFTENTAQMEDSTSLFQRQRTACLKTNMEFELQKLTLSASKREKPSPYEFQHHFESDNYADNLPMSDSDNSALDATGRAKMSWGSSSASPRVEDKSVLNCCEIVEVMSDKIFGRMPHRIRVPLGSTITIGREQRHCKFCIKDVHVSRRHAKLHFSAVPDRQLYLEPISSTNPTLSNNVQLAVNKRHKLSNGDVFKIAHYAFRVELPQSPARSPGSDSIAATRAMDDMANDPNSTLQAGVTTAGSGSTTAGTGIFMEAGGMVVAETLVLSYDDDEEIESSQSSFVTEEESIISKLELALMTTERYKSSYKGENPMSADEFRKHRLKHLKEIEYTLTSPHIPTNKQPMDFGDAVINYSKQEAARKLGGNKYSQAIISTLREDQTPVSRYVLQRNEEVTVGRNPRCGIPLVGKEISRLHCTIRLGEYEATLIPHSKVNPVTVNRRKITGATPLNQGDLIHVSKAALRIELNM